MNSCPFGYGSRSTRENALYASAEIVFNQHIVVERYHNLVSIGISPSKIKAKVTASAVTPRDGDDVAAKHSFLIGPIISLELRVIDNNGAFAVVYDDEARAVLDQRPKILK